MDKPNDSLKLALMLHQQGELDRARRLYEEILRVEPRNAECLHLLGVVATQTGNREQAVRLIEAAIAIAPDRDAFHYNRGLVLHGLQRLEEAVESYERAIALNGSMADTYSNRGLALTELGRLEAALESFRLAIRINPHHAQAFYNRANVLRQLRELDGAIEDYDRAIRLKPDYVAALYNRANVLRWLGRHEAALESYTRALALKPDLEFLPGYVIQTRMELGDWSDFGRETNELGSRIERGEKACLPFTALALFDSPSLQRKAAETFAGAAYPPSNALGPIEVRPRGTRVRIAYFSADFRDHAVSHLSAELFEAHDKDRFELIGFSSGPPGDDDMRIRVSAAFEKFIDVSAKTDFDVAKLSRDLRIDIAVDLGGYTRDSRVGIFALRTAPVQASYLGYLGTMGADYYDYLFADRQVIPAATREHFAENVVWLPSYQANDSRRVLAQRPPSRAELELPERGFAFCCLNNNYKITPPTFSGWMRILAQVPESVLLLYAENPTAMANLRSEAVRRGIDASRIIFAAKLPRPEYLSRFQSLDLFLDTAPYNAGTVASDALWAGLPVLTRAGRAFASRMASSLLTALDLPELITTTQEEYEARAVELARDPIQLAALKEKLQARRKTALLFDTRSHTRDIEAAYLLMHERHCAGLRPTDISIDRQSPPV